MTTLVPILTRHGSKTVLKAGLFWTDFTIDELTRNQRDNIMFVKRNVTPVGHSIAVDATGGTFDLDIGAETLAAVAFDVTASALLGLIEGLTAVVAGDVTVTGGPGDAGGTTPYVISWEPTGLLYGSATPAVTTDPASLTGGAGTAVVTAVNG